MPKTTISSIHAELVPDRSRETLPCNQTHAWSDRSDGDCVRQTTVYELCGRGARQRTSGCPRTLGEARSHRAARTAGTRGDPASWLAHREISEADGLVQVMCRTVRAACAAATVAVLLLCHASAASAVQRAASGMARTRTTVDALGSTFWSSGGLRRHQHHAPAQFVTHEHVSSMSTWRAEMATWPGQHGRF